MVYSHKVMLLVTLCQLNKFFLITLAASKKNAPLFFHSDLLRWVVRATFLEPFSPPPGGVFFASHNYQPGPLMTNAATSLLPVTAPCHQLKRCSLERDSSVLAPSYFVPFSPRAARVHLVKHGSPWGHQSQVLPDLRIGVRWSL